MKVMWSISAISFCGRITRFFDIYAFAYFLSSALRLTSLLSVSLRSGALQILYLLSVFIPRPVSISTYMVTWKWIRLFIS